MQNQKRGIACPPSPWRGRKVKGAQTKKDVYNHVLTKYERLGPFSNPKSEKGAGDMHLLPQLPNIFH